MGVVGYSWLRRCNRCWARCNLVTDVLVGRGGLGISLDAADHLLDVWVFGAWAHDGEAAFVGAPAEDFDVEVFDAVLFHGGLGGFVEVDGVGADECGAVVVDFVEVGFAFDFKNGAYWVNGPVGCGTAHVAVFELGAFGGFFAVFDVIFFGVGVGGGADVVDFLWF